jgi:hypothetical protein
MSWSNICRPVWHHGRANAAGPMAEVVQNSTQYMTPEDLPSIVVYLRSVPAVSGGETHPRDQLGKPPAT